MAFQPGSGFFSQRLQNDAFPQFSFDTDLPQPSKHPSIPATFPTQLTVASGEKKQITRNRASYSCLECRKRKIRCNKVHPICGNCSKNQEKCVYLTNSQNSVGTEDFSPEDSRQGTKRKKFDTESRDSVSQDASPEMSDNSRETPAPKASIEDRLDRLTSLVEALSQAKGGELTESIMTEFGLRQEKKGQKARPGALQKDTDGDAAHAPLSTVRPTFETQDISPISRNGSTDGSQKLLTGLDLPPPDFGDITDPLANLNLGYLSVQEGGRSRYIGSTFWAYMSDEINELNGLLRDQNRYSINRIVNEPCEEACCGSESAESEDSHESEQHNSFHNAGDHEHHQKRQFRRDCPACHTNINDKFILLQTLDSHPSRFKRMDADILAGIPTETQSHILFRCWLSGVHGNLPLIYPPMALKKYKEFWEWHKTGRKTGEPMREPENLALLYAIWYAGSVSISARGRRQCFKGITRAKLSAGFHDQITRCLTMASFPRVASVPSLAAFIMLQVILAKEEEPLTSSLFVGLALRIAQTLGLHRDPTLFNFEPWEVETRRRLWWQIHHIDTYIAIASGLPPLVNERYFDTKMISEVKDAKLGTREAQEYQARAEVAGGIRDNPDDPLSKIRSSMVSVHYVVARGKYIIGLALRDLLKIHLGIQPITRADLQKIKEILATSDQQLNDIMKRIPTKGIPEIGFTPDMDQNGRSLVDDFDPALVEPPSDEDLAPFIGLTPSEGLSSKTVRYHWNSLVAFHKWGRIVLSLLVDKLYCVSYQPFLKNAKSKMWAPARQCALRHCHGFMRKFISLATDPAFQPFQWSWPGTHQPMHATMIMLVDLYERPNSTEAPRSRAFIDKIFAMSSADGGIVSGEDGVTVQRPLREGGQEAWRMLRRLREKAWQKAGLDPDFLWTEEEQIKAGVAKPLTEAQEMAQSVREDLVYKPQPLEIKQNPKQASSQKASKGGETDGAVMTEPSSEQSGVSSFFHPHPMKQVFKIQANGQPPSTENLIQPSFPPSGSTGTIPSFPGYTSHAVVPNAYPNPPTGYYFNPPTADSTSAMTMQGSEALTTSPAPGDPGNMMQLNVRDASSPAPNARLSNGNNYFGNGNLSGDGQTQVTGSKMANSSHNVLFNGHNTSAHFDWDQWDAVFGHHPVFDSMMEDGHLDWSDEQQESQQHSEGRNERNDDDMMG